MTTRTLTPEEARRIAVRAQLLDADRPTELLPAVRRLTFLQLDPTAAIAPAADLVAWTRLGTAYAAADLVAACERRELFEYAGADTDDTAAVVTLRPMSDLALYLPAMAAGLRYQGARDWVAANDGFRRRVLARLAEAGPLQSRDVPDTAEVPWRSTGWTNNRNVTQMLEMLLRTGEVAIAGRQGRQRLWDLAERVYPAGVEALPAPDALRERDARRLRSLGVARPKVVGEAGVEAVVEGVEGTWRVDPDATADGFVGRAALLSPFDRLTHDRARARDLFGFEYLLEMYKPKEKRRWGYFALPVLHHDRVVGKLDATIDRKAGTLTVTALHEDVALDRRARADVDAEVDALAAWAGAERVLRP